MDSKHRTWAAALGAVLVMSPAAVSAQSLWSPQSRETSVSLEVLRPEFDGPNSLKFGSSAMFLGGRWQLNPSLDLVAELPFAYADTKGAGSDLTDEPSTTSVGNPYVGVEYGRRGAPVSLEFGVRAPVASSPFDNQGAGLGLVTDYIERFEAFADHTIPVMARVNYAYRDESGFAVRLRGGSSVLIPTEDEMETELFGTYATRIGYENDRVRVGGVFMGLAWITEGAMDFNERTLHQAGVAADATFGKFRPGVEFRLPLDREIRDSMDYVAGVSLAVMLR